MRMGKRGPVFPCREEVILAKRERSVKPDRRTDEQLPHAEMDVLACLWRGGKATARQVRETMANYRPMTHGAMVTLLRRLEAKGLVTRKKALVGKAFVYRCTRSARPIYRRVLRETVQRIFGGNSIEMVSTLFDTAPPTPKELGLLRQLLDNLSTEAANAEKR